MTITFIAGDLDSADVQALLAQHYDEMRSASPRDACHVLTIAALKDPMVTFWSVRDEEKLLAVGAIKQLSPSHAELKSMRTAPDALGRGVGRALLRHIIEDARSRGYHRLSLETGSTKPFAAALGLYTSEGFTRCGPFGNYKASPFTLFLTREL